MFKIIKCFVNIPMHRFPKNNLYFNDDTARSKRENIDDIIFTAAD